MQRSNAHLGGGPSTEQMGAKKFNKKANRLEIYSLNAIYGQTTNYVYIIIITHALAVV